MPTITYRIFVHLRSQHNTAHANTFFRSDTFLLVSLSGVLYIFFPHRIRYNTYLGAVSFRSVDSTRQPAPLHSNPLLPSQLSPP